MNDSNAHDALGPDQRPREPVPPAEAMSDLPSARYRATLRLIGFRLVDETRSRPKPWWKWKA